jgi:glycosyltransferase involved in cell wall biosynthesis
MGGRGVRPVAYVTTTFPTFAAFIENEVARLHGRGVRVRVFTLRPLRSNYQPDHEPLIPLTTFVGSPVSPRSWLDLLGWLLRRPHVLVPEFARILWASRGSPYAVAGHLAWLPAAARVATLVEREGLERVHGAWAHFPATVAYLAARLTGRRFSMAGHAGSDLYRTQSFLGEKVRAADFVTTCVRANRDMLLRLTPGARVVWIYHGVDRARFNGAGRARGAAPLLLAVGRLAETKGFDTAVRALGALRRDGLTPELHFVGDGPDRPMLERLAREEEVSGQVTFHGWLTQLELLPLYRRAWLLLAPSRVLANGRRDGIPNVIVEALAMGLPCAGTRAAGLEEAIDEGVNGVLAPPDDAEALAAAIAPLLRDPSRIDRMSEAARARILGEFDAERNFERLWTLLETDGAAVDGRAAPLAGGGV